MKHLDMDIISKTMTNLKKNNMDAYYCETKDEVLKLVETLIKEGDTVTHGGSVTLKEVGITDLLNSGKYNYLDRSKCKDQDEIEELYRKSFSADVYFTSSNAITRLGALYNVDGNSNRIAAIAFGPKSVIVIAGYNKIVNDMDDAVTRVKKEAAPLNTRRLNCDTYCRTYEECLAMGKDTSYLCDGCRSPQRICCNYLISAQQRIKGRIKVILVGEKLGY